MDGYESNRRDFLKKLGLIAGATALTVTGVSGVTEIITEKKEQFNLTQEQKKFMAMYEKWLKEFHAMAKLHKDEPDHMGNNKKLMALSEEAKVWQKELIEHMKDENFARYYMIVTEKVTAAI
ncbi:MAG: twin-arginine translocation signal domain-containing protein [Paludibacter sp.]|nr:twin-arginine translocation signal domain-containing protein [Paludibacter sp.]